MIFLPDILTGPALLLWAATLAIAWRWGYGVGHADGHFQGTLYGWRKSYDEGYQRGKQANLPKRQ